MEGFEGEDILHIITMTMQGKITDIVVVLSPVDSFIRVAHDHAKGYGSVDISDKANELIRTLFEKEAA